MAQKPSNLPIVIVVIAAIGGIYALNVMQQKNDPAIQEKLQKEAEQKAAAEESKKAAPQQQAASAPGANEVAGWGPEKMLGKAGGSPSVTVGWSWTPTVQGNPGSIYSAVDTLQKTVPGAAIRVVNLDAEPGAVPAGISVAGKVKVPTMADGTFPPPAAIGAAMH